MAFGFKRADEKDDAFGQSSAQGGAGLVPQQPVNGATSNGAGQSYADFLGGNGGGEATQTGFLNFDRFFNANAGVAGREAKRVNEAAANQAQKAKQGVQGVNQAYIDALDGAGKGVVTPGFDAKGNWQGGAAGPSRTPVNPNGTVDVAPAAPGAPAPGQAAAGPSQRDFLAAQRDAAYNAAQAVPDFTDTEGYGAAGDDVREAQRQLDALGSEAGLAELSGGNWADAALLNAAGREAFQQTRDAYGKKGTGHDSITDYANAVAADSVGRGQMKADELRGYGNEYSSALDAYDAQQAEAAAAPESGGQAPPKTWRDMLADIDAATNRSETALTNNRAQEGWGADIAKFPAAQQIATESGLSPEQAQQAWDRFRNELPPDIRNELDAMLRWYTEADDGDRVKGLGNEGPRFADLDELDQRMAQLQALFRAWLSDNGTTETRMSDGLTSTETRNG